MVKRRLEAIPWSLPDEFVIEADCPPLAMVEGESIPHFDFSGQGRGVDIDFIKS